jgi:hypothetical protein
MVSVNQFFSFSLSPVFLISSFLSGRRVFFCWSFPLDSKRSLSARLARYLDADVGNRGRIRIACYAGYGGVYVSNCGGSGKEKWGGLFGGLVLGVWYVDVLFLDFP